MSRERWAQLLYAATAVWVTVLLMSLRTGWLNGFFFDTSHAHVQGIDFFPVERAWLNLINGRSEFDTFQSGYGPYATWLVYHPAFAIVVGPLLMAFKPWTAYRIWTAISVATLGLASLVLMQRTEHPLRRACIPLLLLGAFPTFVILHSGNVQAVLILSLALIFCSMNGTLRSGPSRRYDLMLMAGLMLSLFSKPIVIAMLPMLLLLPETRRATARAIAVYAVVSFITVAVPVLNPVAMSWAERWSLATHPLVIQQTMNVYTNHFTVTPAMQDNSIHWLAMIGLTDFRMLHVDVYSLPALLDGWLSVRTPEALYRVPLLLVGEVTVLVAFMRGAKARQEAALLTVMAASLLLFLSYGLVWEYHYTGVLVIVGLLLVRSRRSNVERAIIALGAFAWAPGLYFLMSNKNLELLSVQTILRVERVVPVLLIFLLLLGRAVFIALTDHEGLGLIRQRSLRSQSVASH